MNLGEMLKEKNKKKKSNNNSGMRKLFGSTGTTNAGNRTKKTASAIAKTNSAIATYKRAQMDEVYVRFRNWLSKMNTPVRTPRCDDWINTDWDLWTATPLVDHPW